MPVQAVTPAMKLTSGILPTSLAVPAYVDGAVRMVGPIATMVHAPPHRVAPGEFPQDDDVRPHPHIGLATLSYMLEGAMTHRDSIGGHAELLPGDVSYMVAGGEGVVHSERFPRLRTEGGTLSFIQIWIALPDAEQTVAYRHVPAEEVVRLEGGSVRLLAGRWGSVAAQAAADRPLWIADVELSPGAAINVPTDRSERAAYVLSGSVVCGASAAATGETLVFQPGLAARIESIDGARFLLLGGEPVGERLIWWNFVAPDVQRIEEAKRKWREGGFDLPPGDSDEWTPCPPDDGRPLFHLKPLSG
jgi:redox-sensitive bicupin YhaK (pirin superfamily)